MYARDPLYRSGLVAVTVNEKVPFAVAIGVLEFLGSFIVPPPVRPRRLR